MAPEANPLRSLLDADVPTIKNATLSLPLFSVGGHETAIFRLVECNPQARPLDVELQILDEKGEVLVRRPARVSPNQDATLAFSPKVAVVVRGAAQLILAPGSLTDPSQTLARLNSLALSEEIFRRELATSQPSPTPGPVLAQGEQIVVHDGPQPPVEPVRIYAVGPYAPIVQSE